MISGKRLFWSLGNSFIPIFNLLSKLFWLCLSVFGPNYFLLQPCLSIFFQFASVILSHLQTFCSNVQATNLRQKKRGHLGYKTLVNFYFGLLLCEEILETFLNEVIIKFQTMQIQWNNVQTILYQLQVMKLNYHLWQRLAITSKILKVEMLLSPFLKTETNVTLQTAIQYISFS